MGYVDDMKAQIRGEYSPVKRKPKTKVRTVVRYVPVSYGYPMYPQYVSQPQQKKVVRRVSSGTNYAGMLRKEKAKDAYNDYKSAKFQKNIQTVSSGAKVVASGARVAGHALGNIAKTAYQKAPRLGGLYGGIFKKKVSLPKATEKEVD